MICRPSRTSISDAAGKRNVAARTSEKQKINRTAKLEGVNPPCSLKKEDTTAELRKAGEIASSGGKSTNRQYERCHEEPLGSSEGYDRPQIESLQQGLIGLEVAAMEHMLNKSAEAQPGQKGFLLQM